MFSPYGPSKYYQRRNVYVVEPSKFSYREDSQVFFTVYVPCNERVHRKHSLRELTLKIVILYFLCTSP